MKSLDRGGPIGILDEHPEWSRRLMAELRRRRLACEKIDHSSHAFDPREQHARYSVIVNRTSPSAHRRGHGSVVFYAEALLDHYERLGIPVINPVASWRFEKSKALQAGLFERLGVRYPRTVVVNHRTPSTPSRPRRTDGDGRRDRQRAAGPPSSSLCARRDRPRGVRGSAA